MGTYIQNSAVAGRLKAAFARLYALPADQADLDRDIAQAETLADSYISQRYTVPVSDPKALLLVQGWVLDLFEGIAWRRGAGSELPKKIENAANAALDQLKAVAKGSISLAGAATPENMDAGGAALLVDGPKPDFKHDDLEGY